VEVLRHQLAEACQAWLTRSPSVETRPGYARDLTQFLKFEVCRHTVLRTLFSYLLTCGFTGSQPRGYRVRRITANSEGR